MKWILFLIIILLFTIQVKLLQIKNTVNYLPVLVANEVMFRMEACND